MFEFYNNSLGVFKAYFLHMETSVKIRWTTEFMNWGVHLGQNIKQYQAESCLACENGSPREGALPCLQERGGCVELLCFFLGLLRCPSPPSPGTDTLQWFYLNRGHLDPKLVIMFTYLRVSFLLKCREADCLPVFHSHVFKEGSIRFFSPSNIAAVQFWFPLELWLL